MTRESELRDGFADHYRSDSASWQGFWQEAQRDLEFALLAQHTEEEWSKAERQGRTIYTFDKTKRQLDLIEGYEQRNRHILKIGPTEKQDDYACEQHTALIMHIMAGGRGYTGYDCMSTAFKWGSLATGSNLLEYWKDRHGDLRLSRRPFNGHLLDPMLTQPDLSDCSHILTGQWLMSDRVKLILPTESEKIDDIPPMKHSIRWPFMAAPLFLSDSDIFLHEEWWRRQTDYVETVLHRPSGREIPFKVVRDRFGDAKAARDWVNDQQINGFPILTKYSKPVDKMLLTVFINGEPVWDGENPLGIDDYNFIWLHGEWVPECGRSELKLQPFVRCLRDPQRAYNRKTNQAFDIIESQIQSGKIARDVYLKNPEALYKSGQGVNIHVTDEAPLNLQLHEIVQNVQAVDIKPGLFQLLEVLDKVCTTTGGLNEEIFGTDDVKDMPGILHKFRTGAALTGKQGIFSGFRAAKRELGIKGVRIVQRNYDPFKVFRILNEYPVKSFYVEDFDKYDCTPTEGLLTDAQKQLKYLELKELRTIFPDAAQLIPLSYLLRLAPIQGRKELDQMIAAGEKQQNRQMQLQLQNQQRINELVEAQTKADVARSWEDMSDIRENRANTKLLEAKTAVEIQKLRGETARQPYNEDFDKQIRLLELKIEYEKVKAQKKQKRLKKGA
jgi:hypothetical protein